MWLRFLLLVALIPAGWAGFWPKYGLARGTLGLQTVPGPDPNTYTQDVSFGAFSPWLECAHTWNESAAFDRWTTKEFHGDWLIADLIPPIVIFGFLIFGWKKQSKGNV